MEQFVLRTKNTKYLKINPASVSYNYTIPTKNLILVLLVLTLGCASIKTNDSINLGLVKKEKLLEDQLRNWQNLDINKDTLAGISLNRAYQEIIKNKKGIQIAVAVLDTELDINHEDLKSSIWINKKEIPDNDIDDDENGYTDDVHGWNFLGNKKGEVILNQNLSCTRVIRHFKKQFDKNGGKEQFNGNKKDSLLYHKALNICKEEFKNSESSKKRAAFYTKGYPMALATIKRYFPDEKYTYRQVDSLYKVYENDKNRQLGDDIYFMRDVMKYSFNQLYFDNFSKKSDDEFNTTFNDSYHDKDITGDDEDDLTDTNYGSNNVSKNSKWVYHATQVSGLIAANRENNIGLQGFSNTIKIIPLCIIANGGTDVDKDQALAIRYATDNGAKVINMSFSKSVSVHPDWLKEALIYAEQRDVLVIKSAGNNTQDNDKEIIYPTDYDEETGLEFCNNLITVGAITSHNDKSFLANFTNYGKKNVDIFAPGQDLYTTDATRGYVSNRGTSLACAITSGVAALIRSYYPKLTAKQVKQIILDSGVAYDLQVQVPGEKEGVLKPFSEMSKSGKVVNVYNALLMAEKISKKH
jgi:cell wall-associated protease